MQLWIDKIDYGNRDTTAGIDVFWLPAKDRKTILISPAEQARLIRRLVSGTLPFSGTSLLVLKELMFLKKTGHGILYSKTGSGTDDRGIFVSGWFVGYVETNRKTYAFACAVRGENVMSKDARAIVETVLEEQGYLIVGNAEPPLAPGLAPALGFRQPVKHALGGETFGKGFL